MRPALFWESALSAALTGYGANKEISERRYRQDSQGVNWFGAAFEHIWHVVFGQPPETSANRCIGISCPVSLFTAQCRAYEQARAGCSQKCREWDTRAQYLSLAGGR